MDVQSKLGGKSAEPGHLMLVVHLGGTGLEASVIRCENMVAQALGSCGDWKLGTLRWQSALASFFTHQLKELTGRPITEDVVAATRLQRTIELAVDRLTRSSKVDIRFEWLGKTIEQPVTQAGLLKLAPLLSESITKVVLGACKSAKVQPDDVKEVLLAGSMMHMRPLQELVRSIVNKASLPSVLEKSEFARGAALQAHYLTSLSPASEKTAHAITSTSYDFGLLAIDPATGKSTPRVLLERNLQTPTTISKNLKADTVSGLNSLQIIESTRLGEDTWNRLGSVKPNEAFPNRQPQDSLQLRLVVDESGLMDAQLLWPAGNRQHSFGHRDFSLDDAQVEQWKVWLETASLCSGH
jgi:eukaryotic-like serine/threonine-protein kinase